MVVVQCQHGGSTAKWFPAGTTCVGSENHARRNVHELVDDETKCPSCVWVHFWVPKTGFEIRFTEEDVLICICDTKIPDSDQMCKFYFPKGDWGFILS